MSIRRDRPIGVFDSGLGGLTIVRELRKKLPNESIVYYGDLARLPYGNKSDGEIIRYSIFLLRQDVKLLVIACNSSSSVAHHWKMNYRNFPIVDVIQPASEAAARTTKNKKIGVIATPATIESGAYLKAIHKIDSKIKLYSKACPLFVPMVEEGWEKGPIVSRVMNHYLASVKRSGIDTLILGCTHYPLLKTAIQKYMTSKIKLVDSAKSTVENIERNLVEWSMARKSRGKGKLSIFVSDKPRNFKRVGERFLSEKMLHIKRVCDGKR